MSNEELAVLAQQGDKDALLKLWEQVAPFCMMCSFKACRKNSSDKLAACGICLDDFKQESYIAFTEAVKAFDSSTEYKFLTYLNYPLKNAFNRLLGIRTVKGRKEPLNSANSLDEPIHGTDELTVADSVEDEQATKELENVQEDLYTRQLHKALFAAMDLRCTPPQQETLISRYFNGNSLKQCAEAMDVPTGHIRKLESEGLRQLRYPQAKKLLQSFADDIITGAAYSYSTSFGAWKEKGSNPERVIEFLERKMART